jgi:hypothetical protein
MQTMVQNILSLVGYIAIIQTVSRLHIAKWRPIRRSAFIRHLSGAAAILFVFLFLALGGASAFAQIKPNCDVDCGGGGPPPTSNTGAGPIETSAFITHARGTGSSQIATQSAGKSTAKALQALGELPYRLKLDLTDSYTISTKMVSRFQIKPPLN